MRTLFFILTMLVVLSPAVRVEAGNTRSVNAGDTMIPLSWSITNTASPCDPTTTYPAAASPGNIRSVWTTSLKSSSGTENFTGRIVNAPAGTYVFRCALTTDGTVFDESTLVVCNNTTQESDGGSACVPKNQAPVANAGSDRTITLPTSTTTPTGDSASDSDGTVASTVWSNTSRPSGAPAPTITNASTMNPSFSGLTFAGTYVFRLTVTDNDGAVATDTMMVNVNATPNVPPVANAGSDRTITLPTSTTTPTGDSASDSDGTVASTVWSNTSRPSGAPAPTITNASTMNPSFSGLTFSGAYVFRLTVTDNDGATQSDQMTVTVNAAPPPPTINGFTGPVNVVTNGSPTLTWSVVNATNCTINPGAYVTSPVAAGSRAMAAISATTTYTLRCMNGSIGPTTATWTVGIADPNLIVQSTTFPSGPLVRGVAVTLRGTARNVGSVTTGVGFSNNFSYDVGSGWVNPAAGYVAKSVLAGATTASQDSYSFTPTTLSNVRFQYCVDSYNTVAEVGNENPNCVQSGWITVNPPIPPTPTGLNAVTSPLCGGVIDASWNPTTDTDSYRVSLDGVTYTDVGNTTSHTFTGLVPGNTYTVYVIAHNNISGDSPAATDTAVASAVCNDLAVGNCDIPNGSNSCNAVVSWNITGASSPNIYNLTRTRSVSSGLVINAPGFTTSLVRSNALGNQETGDNVIQSRDGTTVLNSRTGVASCLAGSFFHSTENTCQPDPLVTILPTAPLIRSGDQATLTFIISANYSGVTCTFSGGMTGAAPINHTASATPTNYVRTTDSLTAAQLVRIICSVPSVPAGRTVTEEVRVNVVAEPQET